MLEAELHEHALFGQHNEHIHSEMIQEAADKRTYDLRRTTSYLVLSESVVHRLSFEPRRVHPITAATASMRSYSVVLRLRGRVCIDVAVSTRSNETAVGVACASDAGHWHECVVADNAQRHAAVITVPTDEKSAVQVSTLSDSHMELDWVHLVKDLIIALILERLDLKLFCVKVILIILMLII